MSQELRDLEEACEAAAVMKAARKAAYDLTYIIKSSHAGAMHGRWAAACNRLWMEYYEAGRDLDELNRQHDELAGKVLP